jgi:hypothetical protein
MPVVRVGIGGFTDSIELAMRRIDPNGSIESWSSMSQVGANEIAERIVQIGEKLRVMDELTDERIQEMCGDLGAYAVALFWRAYAAEYPQ